MAELLCWDITLSLNPSTKVGKVFNNFTTEIAAFKNKLREIDFPGTLGRSWKITSEINLFVFSKSHEDVNHFLARNMSTLSVKEKVELSHKHGVKRALQTQEDKAFVLPLVLISREDIENSHHSMENILHLSEICLVLTFQPSSKDEFRTILDHLQPNEFVKIPLIFTEDDVMFCGFITRKVKDWVFQSCKNILKSSEEWLKDLQEIPTFDVEICLNEILGEVDIFKKLNLDEKCNANQAAAYTCKSYTCIVEESAIENLCLRTIEVSFNKIRKAERSSRDDPLTLLLEYFQSFMIGMMVCTVKTTCRDRVDFCKNQRKRGYTESFPLTVVEYFEQECLRKWLNKEIQTIKEVINILQVQFIPSLQNIMKTAECHDEVVYEIQIRLSRMAEVRSFGMEDNTFTVYVDSQRLNDNNLLQRLKHAAQPYEIEHCNLLEWTPPVFHGQLIQGENKQCGMITTFAERVNMNGDNLDQKLYFITCAHLAPRPEMPVHFWMCSKCSDRSKVIDCVCEREKLGFNMYPFGRQKENQFDAVIDITCGIVTSHSSHRDTNMCGPHSRPIEIADFSNSIEANTGKTVLKWNNDGNQCKGKYLGVQYINDDLVPKRLHLIKSDGNGESPFGINGHCGALIFLVENEGVEVDTLSPTFVYLGKWTNNKFMCFRLQEGLECLESEHNLKLRLCLDSSRET